VLTVLTDQNVSKTESVMSAVSLFLDKVSISLSATCAIHCLLLPVALVLLPSLAVLPVGDESFHQLLIVLVMPASIFALTMGCRRHRYWRVMVCGFAGLLLLLLAALAGHDLLGEFWEKVLTIIGASLVAIGHVMNFRQCKTVDCDH